MTHLKQMAIVCLKIKAKRLRVRRLVAAFRLPQSGQVLARLSDSFANEKR
ncbi:MAG: hypothetical protein AB1757_06035 [Acidobacteriota bacterium]